MEGEVAMKRKEVYDFISKLAARNAIEHGADVETLVKATKLTENKNRKAIDTMTNGIYSDSGNPKIEILVFIITCCLGVIVLPFSPKLNLILSLIILVIFEFILHKGLKFMLCEFSNAFQRDAKIKKKAKLKYGEFKPVCVGYDSEGSIVVVDYDDKDSLSKFESYNNFIADKEVAPSVIREFRIGRAKDLSVITKVVTKNLIIGCDQVGRASSDYNRKVNGELISAKNRNLNDASESNSF